MPELKTEQVTTHTITLTDAELAEWREAAACALDLGRSDEHAPTWRTIAQLGQPPVRGSLSDQLANPALVGTTRGG